MDRVIITGATSMIGVGIIEACLKHEISKIYAVIRENTLRSNRIPQDHRIEIIKCNVDNYSSLPSLIKEQCDTFFHIAWSVTGSKRNDNIDGQAQNIKFSLDALHAAQKLGCKKFIGAGSQAEFGILNYESINENDPVNPIQPYGIAKYAAGKLTSSLAAVYGLDFFWIRVFSVFGPYDKPTTLISSTISKLLDGECPKMTAGIQKWDYLYYLDAGEAFWSVAQHSIGNKVYCLGSGQSRQLRDYIILLKNCINPSLSLEWGAIPYTKDSIMNLCADISRIKNDTGWFPKVSFEEGIKTTINWMKTAQVNQ